jgi:hypothetical protein
VDLKENTGSAHWFRLVWGLLLSLLYLVWWVLGFGWLQRSTSCSDRGHSGTTTLNGCGTTPSHIDQLVPIEPTQNGNDPIIIGQDLGKKSAGMDLLKCHETDAAHDATLRLLKEMEDYGTALKELVKVTNYNDLTQVRQLQYHLTIGKNLFDKIRRTLYSGVPDDYIERITENALGKKEPSEKGPTQGWLGKASKDAPPEDA